MQTQTKRLEGRPPSPEEVFYLQWGREALKNNINLLNDVLRQLVTLDTALLAALIGFLHEIQIPEWSKAIVLSSVSISLLLAFIGVLPYRAEVDLRKPEHIRVHKEKALSYKRRFLTVAAIFFFLTFAFSILGLITG